jgi:hypothetical protein
MNKKPDLERGVYRVTHTIQVGETNLTAETDFIYRNGDLLLVLEWGGPTHNQHPSLTLPLDPALLTEVPNNPGYYTYSGHLEDPRRRQ